MMEEQERLLLLQTQIFYRPPNMITSLHWELFSWILSCLRKADKNKDDKMTQSELKNFLRLINIEVDDMYAEMLFQVMLFNVF